MKSKPMLYDKLIEKGKSYPRETIGIIGTHHGAGVTHTGMMLAFYMGEEIGKKTAFLECNNHHDMSLIESAYDWGQEEELSFSFHRITCYKEVNLSRLTEIFSDDYECIILDFGTDFAVNRNEFLRCDIKIAVGGQAEWDQRKMLRFMNAVQSIRGSENWLYFIPYASPRIISRLKKEMSRNINSIPFQAEPTMPAKAATHFFDEIFRYR